MRRQWSVGGALVKDQWSVGGPSVKGRWKVGIVGPNNSTDQPTDNKGPVLFASPPYQYPDRKDFDSEEDKSSDYSSEENKKKKSKSREKSKDKEKSYSVFTF